MSRWWYLSKLRTIFWYLSIYLSLSLSLPLSLCSNCEIVLLSSVMAGFQWKMNFLVRDHWRVINSLARQCNNYKREHNVVLYFSEIIVTGQNHSQRDYKRVHNTVWSFKRIFFFKFGKILVFTGCNLTSKHACKHYVCINIHNSLYRVKLFKWKFNPLVPMCFYM